MLGDAGVQLEVEEETEKEAEIVLTWEQQKALRAEEVRPRASRVPFMTPWITCLGLGLGRMLECGHCV